MDLEDAKLRLDEEGYYILEDVLDPREAERLDSAARALMEPKVDTNQRYLSMEDSLNTTPVWRRCARIRQSSSWLKRYWGKSSFWRTPSP